MILNNYINARYYFVSIVYNSFHTVGAQLMLVEDLSKERYTKATREFYFKILLKKSE